MAKKKKQSLGLGRWILILICLIVFCACAYQVLSYVLDKIHAENDFKEIRESARDLSELYEQNHDLIGWVQIKDTKIDYPVMQTPTDPEFYLHRDFEGEDSASGTPFLDAASVVMPRPITPDDQVYGQYYDESTGEPQMLQVTWNWLIYGHNMKSGKMFGTLDKYKNEDYYKEHPLIEFDTIYEKGIYRIMYVFPEVVHEASAVTFKYYQFIEADSEEEYDSNMQTMAEMSLYDTGVTSSFGDELITLSTCDYEPDAERFAVVAKRVE